jgi:ligand-binding sensor domain-containing protein
VLKPVYRTLLMLLLVSLAGGVFGQSTYIQHFGVRDGLPSNTCYYTLQDSKGYIWIGTDAGVSRFDGKYFKNFSVDDGLPDNQVLQMKEDKAGRIWFLSLNGKLSFFLNGRIYNDLNSNLLKLLKFNDIIVSFFEDSKGRIWLGSNKNRLYVWDGKFLTKYVSKDRAKQFLHSFIHEDKAGTIWVISQQGTMVFRNQKFHPAPKNIAPLSFKTIAN